MKPTTIAQCLSLAALAGAGFTLPARATVTAFFSAGSNCAGPATAEFTTGGPAIPVTLCANTTEEGLCGATIQLQAAAGREAGRFNLTKLALSPAFPERNMLEEPGYPMPILYPAQRNDLGGGVPGSTPNPPGANQVLASFEFTPATSAVRDAYVISLSSFSIVAHNPKTCADALGAPISASFTFKHARESESGMKK